MGTDKIYVFTLKHCRLHGLTDWLDLPALASCTTLTAACWQPCGSALMGALDSATT
jgi:hypothetical protein